MTMGPVTRNPVKRNLKEVSQPQVLKDHGTSELGMIVTDKQPACTICQKLQARGQGERYFENHIISDELKSYNSSCPNYLGMTLAERVQFLAEHDICRYCVFPKTQLGDEAICPGEEECKSKNLQIVDWIRLD